MESGLRMTTATARAQQNNAAPKASIELEFTIVSGAVCWDQPFITSIFNVTETRFSKKTDPRSGG
jgi:hypothetical protein